MNITHLGSELRRFFHGTLPPLGLAVIVLLPLIFGGLFTWSYLDPIGGMKDMPVALVNSDKGTELNGKPLNAGNQITQKLLDNKSLKFVQVSPEEARRGVTDGEYYFAVELPTDFSSAAASANTDTPHAATINATFENANGFIATVLGNQATIQVVNAVNDTLGKQVADTLLVGFNTIGDGMAQAANGADTLNKGIGTATDGAQQLADGTEQARSAAGQLNNGAQQLNSGAQQLRDGAGQASQAADQLANGLDQLVSGTDDLGAGAGAVSGGVDQIVGLTGQATATQEHLAGALVNISTQLRGSGVGPAIQLAGQVDQLVGQIRTQGLGPDSDLVNKLSRLKEGAAEIHRQLTDPQAEYRAGMNRAADGAHQLATGLNTLSDGSTQLAVGINRLADGTSQLVPGTEQLAVGAAALRDGLVRIGDGSGELTLKISDGSQQVPRFEGQRRDAAAATIASPVIEQLTGQGLTRFGVGLAPFFVSLGLFMGGTVMFMLLHGLQRRAMDSRMSPLRVVLSTYAPALLIGWAQATVMWAVLVYWIGLAPQHRLGLWLAMLGISATFVAITHAINAFFGAAVGRVLCLVFMAVSMVSSGGLYPVETQPLFQRTVNVFDPVTYSVNLLRQMIVGSAGAGDPRLWEAIGVLAVYLVLMVAISSFAAWRSRLIPARKLHPELTL